MYLRYLYQVSIYLRYWYSASMYYMNMITILMVLVTVHLCSGRSHRIGSNVSATSMGHGRVWRMGCSTTYYHTITTYILRYSMLLPSSLPTVPLVLVVAMYTYFWYLYLVYLYLRYLYLLISTLYYYWHYLCCFYHREDRAWCRGVSGIEVLCGRCQPAWDLQPTRTPTLP